jgi:hypothetical protein
MYVMRRIASRQALVVRTASAHRALKPVALSGARFLSGKASAPESFFDEEVEAMREHLDVQLAGRKGSVRNITKVICLSPSSHCLESHVLTSCECLTIMV